MQWWCELTTTGKVVACGIVMVCGLLITMTIWSKGRPSETDVRQIDEMERLLEQQKQWQHEWQ